MIFPFFVISSSECNVVLFVVLCGVVWFRVVLRCLFVSIERSASVNQLQIQSMIWTSTLQIRKHGYSGDFDLIILFVGILSLYAINLDVVSLFAVSSFTFLVILMMLLYLMYSINLNEWISFCFCQKKNMSTYNFHLVDSYTTRKTFNTRIHSCAFRLHSQKDFWYKDQIHLDRLSLPLPHQTKSRLWYKFLGNASTGSYNRLITRPLKDFDTTSLLKNLKIISMLNSSFHPLTFTKLWFWPPKKKKLQNRPLSFATVAALAPQGKNKNKKNNTWHLT